MWWGLGDFGDFGDLGDLGESVDFGGGEKPVVYLRFLRFQSSLIDTYSPINLTFYQENSTSLISTGYRDRAA